MLINNRPTATHVLQNGDRVTIGNATLKVEFLREIGADGAAAPLPDVPEAPPPGQPLPKPDDPSALGWDVPLSAEVDKPESQSALFEMATATNPQVGPPNALADDISEGTVKAVQDLVNAPEVPAEEQPPPEMYKRGELILTCLEGPSEGSTWRLEKESTTLGRDRNADVSMRDLSVSRQHAAVMFTDKGVEARDLGSRNGIHVNGRRCRHAMLNAGDTLRVGTCLFLIDRAQPGGS